MLKVRLLPVVFLLICSVANAQITAMQMIEVASYNNKDRITALLKANGFVENIWWNSEAPISGSYIDTIGFESFNTAVYGGNLITLGSDDEYLYIDFSTKDSAVFSRLITEITTLGYLPKEKKKKDKGQEYTSTKHPKHLITVKERIIYNGEKRYDFSIRHTR